MNGFLDRLAARAVGEAPLVHPRVRSRFEPDAGVMPGGTVEEVAEERSAPAPARPVRQEGFAAPRGEERSPAVVEEARTFEPEPRRRPAVSSLPGPSGTADLASEASIPREVHPTVETPRGASPSPEVPAPLRGVLERTGAAAGDAPRGVSTVGERDAETSLASSPPLPGEGSADGRGGRGVRVREAPQSAELRVAELRDVAAPRVVSDGARQAVGTAPPAARDARQDVSAAPQVVSGDAPPRVETRGYEWLSLRDRDNEAESRPLVRTRPRAESLPTVEPDRHAPLPAAVMREEGEPSETVVQVSIGRIDVRAAQPAAPERRPSRPSGPRLSLADYLKGREERRR